MTHSDTMTKEKSTNDKKIGLNFFYNLFLKRKRLYPVRYFLNQIDTRKYTIPLPKKKFKSIVSTYLDVYFGELYYENKPKYFLLSGMIVKTKSSTKFFNGEASRTINWIWYLRPSISYFANIKLIKLKGSTSRVWKLDKLFKKNNDIDIMQSTKLKLVELKIKNKLFKNV